MISRIPHAEPNAYVSGLRVRSTCLALILLLFFVASLPTSAMMERRSLNQLVNDSKLIVVGKVLDQHCEIVDGHIVTKIRLGTEQHAELGQSPGEVEFTVPGGVLGDRGEWVSDTPLFKVGERVLTMLHPTETGKLAVTSRLQGKFVMTQGDRVNGSAKTLATLLSEIAAIREGTAGAEVEAPAFIPDTDAVGQDMTAASCCAYIEDNTYHYPARWCVSPCCPTIHFSVYANGVAGSLAAILQAVDSWNSVPCSCATLSYDGPYATCSSTNDGQNVVCFDNLDSGIIGETTSYLSRFAGETRWTIKGFDLKLNTDYPWSTTCESTKMDVETVALHELGHALALDDLYSAECSSYVMYGYGSEGDCNHNTCLDEPCLSGLYPTGLPCSGCSCTLTMAVSPADGGTTTPSVGAHSYQCDTVVDVAAVPAQGYMFLHWDGPVANSNSASTTVTLNSSQTVTASFVPIPVGDCSSQQFPIPDPGTVESPITVTKAGTIIDVNVTMSLTHTYDADLDIFLVAPDGTLVELSTDLGGSGDNFTNTVLDDEATTAITAGTAPFTGRYRPEGPLSALDDKTAAGIWKLRCTDDLGVFPGTLDSWCLDIEVVAGSSVSEAKTNTNGTDVTLAGKVVTAALADSFYIEDADRCSGIRVNSIGHGAAVGDNVIVGGLMSLDNGERVINAPLPPTVVTSGDPLPDAIDLRSREVGGQGYALNPGVTGGRGALNVGLRIRLQGMVTAIDPAATPAWYYVWDGANRDQSPTSDGSGNTGVRVAGAPPAGTAVWRSWVDVTGVVSASASTVPGRVIPIILPTDADRVTAFDTIAYDAGTALMDKWNLMGLPVAPAATGDGDQWSAKPWDPYMVLAPNRLPEEMDSRMYRWENCLSGLYMWDTWSETGARGPFGGLVLGDGYWLTLDTDWAVSYSGRGSALDQWIGACSPGWMLISHPKDHRTSLADVKVHDGATIRSMADAVLTDDWFDCTGYWWDSEHQGLLDIGVPGCWPTTDTLEPWRGYWLLANRGGVSLIVPESPAAP